MRYQVFPEHSLYVVHYFGDIDELGLLRFFDQVFADPSVTPDMNELALVAEGTQFNVSEEVSSGSSNLMRISNLRALVKR